MNFILLLLLIGVIGVTGSSLSPTAQKTTVELAVEEAVATGVVKGQPQMRGPLGDYAESSFSVIHPKDLAHLVLTPA